MPHRLTSDDYEGLHRRYDEILGDTSTLECAALKDFSDTIANAWRNALKALHRRGFSPAGLDPEAIADPGVLPLIDATASALDSAISRAPLSDTMRQRLADSNFIFSGLKTFHSLNEAFPAMVDSDGNLKPFEQFLNDVQKIENRYNVNYLRAEYNFAVASAQSAARWEQIAADGDRYDLQYRTASDSRVRPEHAALHGVTLPPSSPFWDSFMPPNGWNCRCTAVQVRKGKYPHTDIAQALERGERATIRDTRGMMRFNPGKLGKTFPDYNPYTIRRCRDCDIASSTSTLARTSPPDSSLCQACQILRKHKENLFNRIALNKKHYDILRENPEYKDVSFIEVNGGLRATHIEHNFDKKKGWYETEVQRIGYENGNVVILEREVHNIHNQNNTEGTWNYKIMEIAAAENGTSANLRNALKHCASKNGTQVAVIYSLTELTNNDIRAGLTRYNGLHNDPHQWRQFEEIVFVFKSGKIKKYRHKL